MYKPHVSSRFLMFPNKVKKESHIFTLLFALVSVNNYLCTEKRSWLGGTRQHNRNIIE